MDLSHPYDLAVAVERQSALDAVSAAVAAPWRELLRDTPVRDLVSGRWLGHPVHPVATDAAVGAWMSATVLDVFGPRRFAAASDLLTAVGLVASIPTVISGWSEWLDTEGSARRAGLAHATVNGLASAAYGASLRNKRRGRRGVGVLFSLVGAAALGVGGYLGGHIAYARGAGVDRTAFEPRPTDWVALPEVPEDAHAATVEVDGASALVVRHQGLLHVVADRCTRCGVKLVVAREDAGLGTRGRGAQPAAVATRGGVAACRRDGSRFAVTDGRVLRGPAAAPLPVYETRVRRGQVEVRDPLAAVDR